MAPFWFRRTHQSGGGVKLVTPRGLEPLLPA